MRGNRLLESEHRLERSGENLASAYHTLRDEFTDQHWQTTMDYVRLGLGDGIEKIATRVDAGGGAISLSLKMKGIDRQIPAAALSDGMLSYLAFVAIYRLDTPRSLDPG